MGEDSSQYRVVLKPTAVPLANASTVKMFDVPVDDCHPDPHIAALEYLHETDKMDPYALQSHWEVHHVYDLSADAVEQLEGAFIASEYDPQHWDGHHVPFKIRVHARHNVWRTATLGVQRATHDAFTEWRSDLDDAHPDIANVGDRYLYYAMLRVVADEKPDLPKLAFTDPVSAHDIFLSTALANRSDVIDAHTTSS